MQLYSLGILEDLPPGSQDLRKWHDKGACQHQGRPAMIPVEGGGVRLRNVTPTGPLPNSARPDATLELLAIRTPKAGHTHLFKCSNFLNN